MADVASLIKQLTDPNDSWQSNAPTDLKAIGQPAIAPLAAALATADKVGRMRIALVLFAIRDVQALPHLLGLVNDPEPDVREVISSNLSKFITDRRVAPILEKMALSDPDWSVRKSAAYTLENRIKGFNTTPLLIKQMYDESIMVSVAAIEALGKKGSEEAVTALLKALTDIEPRRLYTLVTALGTTRSPRAFNAFVRFLKSDKPVLRAAAATALGEIGDDRAVAYITPLLNDKQIAYQGERGIPDRTVAEVAQAALNKFPPPKKKSWRFGR